MIYTSDQVQQELPSQRTNPDVIGRLSYMQSLIKFLCESLADTVSQINITLRGDIEIRFIKYD